LSVAELIFAIESSSMTLLRKPPQSPQAHVFGVIGVLGYIKRVMPLRIEGQLSYRFFVSEVLHLLKNLYSIAQ